MRPDAIAADRKPRRGIMNRPTILIMTAVILLGLSGCNAPQQEAAQVLKVGSQKGSTKALMIASGVLDGAPYRVEWAEFPAAQHLLEAVSSGAIDFGGVGDAPFLFAYQSNGTIRAISASSMRYRQRDASGIIVPAGSSIRTIRDLIGKRIATTRGSAGHDLALKALERAHIPATSVKFVWLAPGDAKAAFASGSIDAWSIWVPFLSTARQAGARTIVDAADYGPSFGFNAANKDVINPKRAIIADFLRREARALEWAQSHDKEYSAVLARDTGLPIDVARDVVTKLGRVAVPIDDAVIADQRQILERFERAGALQIKRSLQAGYDKSFADTAVAVHPTGANPSSVRHDAQEQAVRQAKALASTS